MIRSHTEVRCFLVLAMVMLFALLSRTAGAVVVHEPGYIVSVFATMPVTLYSPSDIEVDGAGHLYIPTLPDAIRRLTPLGGMTTWSTAPAVDLTLQADGSGYGAGRSLCHCIVALGADGSYSTLLADGNDWTWVDLTPGGTLYASIYVGDGVGLYTINRSSGLPSVVVAGAPGGPADYYQDMAAGADGNLYTIADAGLYRLAGDHFEFVVALPHSGSNLTLGPGGHLFTATSYFDLGEVWRIDPIAGTATLFASELSAPSGIAYDPLTGRLYVSEQDGDRAVYAFTAGATPTVTTTWGRLKALYR